MSVLDKAKDYVKRSGQSLKKRSSNAFDKFHGENRIGTLIDYLKGGGEWLSAAGRDVREGYRRYKEPIIIGGGAGLGAVAGSIIPGLGTMAGATLGASLAGTARQVSNQRKASKAIGDEADAINAMERKKKKLKNQVSNIFRPAGEANISYRGSSDPYSRGPF